MPTRFENMLKMIGSTKALQTNHVVKNNGSKPILGVYITPVYLRLTRSYANSSFDTYINTK